ncbi:hypothetical protein C5B85_02525 [Pseudoclavibacter sp. AY1F1]|nr:hypothetical protein C5B85_02525 [Pseudoclavibacter sp. AY1F1]
MREQNLAPKAPDYGPRQNLGPLAEGHWDGQPLTPSRARSFQLDTSFLTTSALHGARTAVAAFLSGAALLGAVAFFLNAGASGGSARTTYGFDISEALWQLFLVLTSLPFSGQLHAGFESVGGFFNTGDQGFTLGVWPLASLGFVAISSFAAALVLERSRPMRTRARRAGGAAAAAGAFALLMLLVAAPGMRIDSMGAAFTVSSLTPSLAFVAFIVVFASGWLGRSVAARKQTQLGPSAVHSSTRAHGLAGFLTEVGIYAGCLAVTASLLGGIFVVVVFVQNGSQGAALPALLAAAPHGALAALVLGHFGTVTVNVPFAASETISVFSPELPLAWLAPLLILLTSLGASLIIGVGRAPTRFPEWSRAWRLPALTLLTWIVSASVLLPITLNGSASVFGLPVGDVGFGARPAFWTPALFALWAVVVELGAWILPRYAALLAPGLHASAVRLRRRMGSVESERGQTWGATGPSDTTAPPNRPQIVEARPLSAQAKRRLRLAGILTVVAVLVGTGAAIAVTTANTQRSAVAQAREYMDAIAAGNATRANGLVDPNVETSLRDYVSDEMLASATERITVLDVVETELRPADSDAGWFGEAVEQTPATGRETQNVQVTYRLGGITETAVLVAERVDNELLVLERWRVITPLVFESAAGSSHAVDMTIGSVTVTPGRVESSTWEGNQPVSWVPFTAYPGIYPVTGTESTFYSVASEPVRVGQPVEQFVPDRNVVYTPTESLETAVQAAVTQKIDECAASTAASTEGCPFGTYIYNSSTTVTWSVASYPTVTMSKNSNSFEVEDGMASYSYSGSSGRAVTGSDTIWGTGTFTVDGDVVTIEFR